MAIVGEISQYMGSLNRQTVFLVLAVILYMAMVYYLAYRTITGGTRTTGPYNNFMYFTVAFVPVVLLYYNYGMPNFSNTSIAGTVVSIAYFAAFLGAIYGIIYLMGNFSYILGAGSVVIGALIVLVAMSIISEATRHVKIDQSKSSQILNWLKFLWKFIFYIPCLITDFIQYINDQLEITPAPIWSLLTVEIGLLLLLHYFPSIVKNVTIHDGKLLVNEPMYLNQKVVVGAVPDIFPKADVPRTINPYFQKQDLMAGGDTSDNDVLGAYQSKLSSPTQTGRATDMRGNVVDVACRDVFMKNGAGYAKIENCMLEDYDPTYSPATTEVAMVDAPTYIRSYSIAFWVFINPHPAAVGSYSIPTNIIRIGKYTYETADDRKKGVPLVTYFVDAEGGGETDGAVGKYRFYLSDDQKYYDVSAPEQKWNLFVINFSESVDVFLNGDLVITKKINNGVPKMTDTFVVGEDGGLDGAICSVVFFPRPLTHQQIKNYFYSLKMNDPPVIEVKK